MPADPCDVAWAAGLFEGEGCFSCRNRFRDGRKQDRGLAARIKMTDEDVLQKFHDVVGIGTLRGPYKHNGKKPIWIWQCGAYQDVKYVMDLLRPWLCSRRRARIDALLAWYHNNEPIVNEDYRDGTTGRLVTGRYACKQFNFDLEVTH